MNGIKQKSVLSPYVNWVAVELQSGFHFEEAVNMNIWVLQLQK